MKFNQFIMLTVIKLFNEIELNKLTLEFYDHNGNILKGGQFFLLAKTDFRKFGNRSALFKPVNTQTLVNPHFQWYDLHM